MLLKELVIIFLVAAVFSAAAAAILHKKTRQSGFIWLFLLYIMIVWAGGVWLQPFGPTLFDVHWLPFVVVAIAFSLIVILFANKRPPHGRLETLEKLDEMAREKELEKATYLTLGTLFWVVVIFFILAIILRYI